jgi:cytochrome P450
MTDAPVAPPRYPPGPRNRYPGELLLRFRGSFLGFMAAAVAEYGPVVGFNLAGARWAIVNDPELIRDILVTHQRSFAKGRALERAQRVVGTGLLTSEGEFHLRQRRLAQPAFHRDRIAAYAEQMVVLATRTAHGWRDGATVDMHDEMMHLTLAVVSKTLFDANVDADSDEIGAAVTTVLASFALIMLPFPGLIERLPLPFARRFRKARARLDETIFGIIAARRASGEDRGDLLSMLLHATDAEGDGTGMSDRQLRDEVLTIFLAGHETTANVLTFAWYLLAEHPEVAARLQAEVDALGRAPSVADLPRLGYTRQVVAETMRLYPPAYAIGRRALEDYRCGDFVLRKGTIVLVLPWLQQRDARWWPDPTRFDPDRWAGEQHTERPKFSYFPFGAGTRICIGEQFAWTEAILMLATLAQRWTASLVPGHPVALQPRITLRPAHGMRMVLHQRAASSSVSL